MGGGRGLSADALYATTDGPVATIWLNRPDKRNAITRAMWEAMPPLLGALAADEAVRVVVVRGAAGTFSAGADIVELGAQLSDPASAAGYGGANRAAEEALATFPKPTIALIEGACVGGGCEIAVACDLRFADADARFGITPARLGIVYPAFALERVARLLGPAATKRLLFSAELVGAEHALRIGLVDEVVAGGKVEERVMSYARMLAGRSLLTQMAVKEMVRAVSEDGGIGSDLEARWQDELRTSPDTAEGIAAFAEGREPRFRWSGRQTDDP